MNSEAGEQVRLHQWLRRNGVLHCHVPNGGWRDRAEAAQFRGMGVSAGVPDLLIFDAPPAQRGKVGVALELKRVGGKPPTEAQRQWLSALAERGWVVVVGYGFSDAKDKLTALGYGG